MEDEKWVDDGVDWGFVVGDQFVVIPKPPLRSGGFKQPPFNVTLPSGQVRHIIRRPENG